MTKYVVTLESPDCGQEEFFYDTAQAAVDGMIGLAAVAFMHSLTDHVERSVTFRSMPQEIED